MNSIPASCCKALASERGETHAIFLPFICSAPTARCSNGHGTPACRNGSYPSTYVSWVVNNCGLGYDIGRLDAGGLYYLCTPVSEDEARPGDLVFFEHTFEGPWITHVGICVGDGWMIHAGSPISYIKFMDSYYSDNFVGFGRLPAP